MFDTTIPARSQQRGVVYMIHAEGTNYYKIGYSNLCAEFRRSQMQTGCPHRLSIVTEVEATTDDEQRMHGLFANRRKRGEWFELNLREAWSAVTALTTLSNERAELGKAAFIAEHEGIARVVAAQLRNMHTPKPIRVFSAGPGLGLRDAIEATQGAMDVVLIFDERKNDWRQFSDTVCQASACTRTAGSVVPFVFEKLLNGDAPILHGPAKKAARRAIELCSYEFRERQADPRALAV